MRRQRSSRLAALRLSGPVASQGSLLLKVLFLKRCFARSSGLFLRIRRTASLMWARLDVRGLSMHARWIWVAWIRRSRLNPGSAQVAAPPGGRSVVRKWSAPIESWAALFRYRQMGSFVGIMDQ